MRYGNVMLLVLALAAMACISPAAEAQLIAYEAGFNIEKGFDTTGIENPADMQETDWSAWLAVQLGLDPTKDCEVRTFDGSRIDILTCCEAVEVEWSTKWKESVGQALLYSAESGKQPAVILLSKGEDQSHLLRCQIACLRAGVRMYVQRVPVADKDHKKPESDLKPASIRYGDVIVARLRNLHRKI